MANATTVQVGTPLTNRNFHTGSDVDWFVVNLSGGLRYRISAQAGGSGLGLAIVKHIIEAHEGTVEVQSEVGKGSTFSFTLKT